MFGKTFCEVCLEELSNNSIKGHMEQIHFQNQDKKYQCEPCEKAFFKEQSLLSHSSMHDDKRKHCKICSRSFKRAVPKSHMMKHGDTSTKIYDCQVCPKSFPSLNGLRNHVKKVQKAVQALQCPQCIKTFKGAGAFHSAGQSKEGSVGFGTSQHPIFMKLLPDHLWH